jgi:hypothetical protein
MGCHDEARELVVWCACTRETLLAAARRLKSRAQRAAPKTSVRPDLPGAGREWVSVREKGRVGRTLRERANCWDSVATMAEWFIKVPVREIDGSFGVLVM